MGTFARDRWTAVWIAAALLVVAGVAQAKTTVLTPDGIAAAEAERFDRAAAVVSDGMAITSAADGAVIPANHRRPLMEWSAPEGFAGPYLLEVTAGDLRLDVLTDRRSWTPAKDELVPYLQAGGFSLVVFARSGASTIRSAAVRILVDERPLTDRIAFRVVQPLFNPALPNALKVFSFDGDAVTLMEFPATCVGCHVYSGSSALFNVKRGPRRMLAGAARAKGTFEMSGRALGEFSFLSLSPDGGAAAVVLAPVGKLAIKQTSEEPFDYPYQQADVSRLDAARGEAAPLAGASDPSWVEDMPFFSHDGSSVLFSRYRSETREGVEGIFAMEIWRVPWNGGAGGEATPVIRATAEAPWNYFPRCSPDGRWISFCRGDATLGVYARRTSDIWIAPASGGEPRRLRLNRDGGMDSWHSWSTDSRWLAFASKREPGGMTALYLARIGPDGVDAPPVKLAGFPSMKVNTPTFVPEGLGIGRLTGATAFVDSLFAPGQAGKKP